MYRIVRREQFGPGTFLWDVLAPAVAKAARPGHFVMVRTDETGERIPLTVADYDPAGGTVTVVVQAVGKTTPVYEALHVAGGVLKCMASPTSGSRATSSTGKWTTCGGRA